MTQPAALPAPSQRDGRLDVLRGLCLLNMVLVHCIERGLAVPGLVDEVLMHWLRFAAGGFILTSGLCVGAIHYRKALDPTRRWGVYRSLLKRAGLVLLVHYFATFLSLVLVPLQGYRTYDTWGYVRDVLCLWTGYDLLMFYVVMLLAAPVVVELIRRAGPYVVGAASVALFFVSYDNPYLPLYGIENHFPVIRWQAVFVFGMLLGTQLTRYDALRAQTKWRLLIGSTAATVAIAGLSALERLHGLTLPWYLTVTKWPLSPLEVVRYLSIVVAMWVSVDLLWKRIVGTRPQKVVQLVGAQSLLLWVVHVPIVANVVTLNWLVAPLIACVGVWVAARVAIYVARQWASAMPSLPRLNYLAPVIGSLAVIALLINLQEPAQIATGAEHIEPTPVTDEAAPADPIPFDDAPPDDTV